MTLYTCPVLAFTPDVEHVLEWFRLTYALEGGFGRVQWRRRSLPYDGALADQPAHLIDAMDFVADARNALNADEMTRQRRGRDRGRGDQHRRG